MRTLEFLKLEAGAAKNIANALNQLLADYQIFYTNLRGFHWNVKGKDFFVLHAEFEKLYNNANEKADEIAERILMLDGVPAHRYSDYLKISKIKESEYETHGDTGLKHVLESYSYFIESERQILIQASVAGDEATVAMMSDYIREQEKMVWMLTAYSTK